VRITDDTGTELNSVYLALSDEEAKELSDVLADLLKAEPGWHAHVSDRSFKREVTLYREDDPTASA
jgi:hypothetical protein